MEGWVDRVPNLAVLKSLSKSFGIGGLRLGYLLTANEEFADAVRSELHIWNINGFAESFLREAPRWRKAFRQSCALVHEHCDQLYEGLNAIPGITAYRPQANFVMCRLTGPGSTGPVIAKRLATHGLVELDVQRRGTKPEPGQPHRLTLGLRWIVEATNSWLSNYGQLRRNTDRRNRHRHAALCLATTVLIIGKLIDWRDRWSPDSPPIR